MKIITNNQPRDLLYWYDLTEKEQADFDHIEDGEFNGFRYKGQVYDLGEFVRILSRSQQNNGYHNSFAHTCDDGDTMLGWSGVQSETYFSGVLVKLLDGGDSVIVGRYFS